MYTSTIRAVDDEHAAALALDQVRGEPRLALAAVAAPVLRVEEIEMLDGAASTMMAPGIVFYPARP